MKNNKIEFVREIYRDEENTLAQGIVYKYGDDRERDFHRGRLNPHMTVLMITEYMNSDWDIVDVVKEEK